MNYVNNVYTDYYSLLKGIRENGLETKPRDLKIHELINTRLTLTPQQILLGLPSVRDIIDPNTNEGKYLRAEFVWYMSGSLDTDFISKFGSMWNSIRNEVSSNDPYYGKVNSNYGFHVFHKNPVINHSKYDKNPFNETSYNWILKELTKDIESRKAIIQYNWPVIYKEGVKDFTCTQNQQFLVRDGLLYNIIHIRSSDAILGLTFDIPWWFMVGLFLSKDLNIPLGDLIINIGSSHYYERNDEIVSKILDKGINKNLMSPLDMYDNNTIINNLKHTACMFIEKYLNSKNVGVFDSIQNPDYMSMILEMRVIDPEFSNFQEILIEMCKFISCRNKQFNMNKEEFAYINDKIFACVFKI